MESLRSDSKQNEALSPLGQFEGLFGRIRELATIDIGRQGLPASTKEAHTTGSFRTPSITYDGQELYFSVFVVGQGSNYDRRIGVFLSPIADEETNQELHYQDPYTELRELFFQEGQPASVRDDPKFVADLEKINKLLAEYEAVRAKSESPGAPPASG